MINLRFKKLKRFFSKKKKNYRQNCLIPTKFHPQKNYRLKLKILKKLIILNNFLLNLSKVFLFTHNKLMKKLKNQAIKNMKF